MRINKGIVKYLTFKYLTEDASAFLILKPTLNYRK